MTLKNTKAEIMYKKHKTYPPPEGGSKSVISGWGL